MALTPGNALGVNSQRIAGLVKTIDRTANALPNAIQVGGQKTAMQIKPRWFAIAAANGIPQGGKIARQKWRISDSTRGKSKASATLIISFDGKLNLVLQRTIPHIIGAKLLGTRGSNYRLNKLTGQRERVVRVGAGIAGKQQRLAAGSAFGVRSAARLNKANRGVFGQKQVLVNYSRYGSKRQQAKMGELRRREGQHALKMPDGNLRAYAFHPGTTGKRTVWPEAKRVAIEIGSKTFSGETNKALAMYFGKGVVGAASAATGGTL